MFAPTETLRKTSKAAIVAAEIAKCVLCRSALVAEWFSSASSLLRICPCSLSLVKPASGVRGSG